MFGNCKALERLNLPDVDLNDVVRSYAMFDDCDSLKEIYMEHPFNLDKYEHELIFGNCKAEVKSFKDNSNVKRNNKKELITQ